ncbi:MAG TPA: DUF3987 domain-containing protein, partial [Moraxellaceae bacterium]|nr:DUF3987 domain-containing protein [Moraxellaceae bacterium]
GVGFAFLPGDGLIGIDLDIKDDPEKQKRADAILAACASWAEVSPSGKGLHIIVSGETETFKHNGIGIEVFCGRQFFTMTGNRIPGTPDTINPIAPEVLAKLQRTVQAAKDADREAKEAAKPAAPAAAPGPVVPASSEASRYCMTALESAVQRLRSAQPGGRNDLLNGEAYGLAQLIHTGGISESTIRGALQDAAMVCGLTASEAKATINSGIRAGLASPRAIPAREHPARPPRPAAPAPAPRVDPETGEILDPPANDNAPVYTAGFGAPLDVFGVQPPPALPLDVLPDAFVPYVRDQADLTGCDPAIIALGALVAAAACITDGVRLQPKRHDPTWTESARLWVAFVGDPSTKKSPAISKAVRHVKRIDHRMAEENARAFAEHKDQHDQWKEAKKADKSLAALEPKPPAMQRLVVEDITVEALTEVLKDNPRGVLTLKDELTGWFASMDAYKGANKGASMDRAHWLEAYNGGRRSIDRITRGSVVVPNWSTCIIGGVQPDMMRRVASGMGNDGLLQRFMVLVARPAVLDVDRAPDMRAMEDFGRLFDHLAGIGPSTSPVLLTEEAHRSREKVARYAKRMIDAFDHPHVQAWLGKWDGLYARLLLTYHVIDCATDGVYPTERMVDGHTADKVERLLCGTLLHHAIHFYSEIVDANDRQEHIRQLARLILAKGFERITKRDISLLWKASRRLEWWELRQIIDALCTMDWLAPDPDALDTDGKPRAWFVNPAVHSMFTAAALREQERRRAAAETLREIRQAYEMGT